MSENCNDCKRPVEEYYKVGKSSILCYDCYTRKKNDIQIRSQKAYDDYQRVNEEYYRLEKELDILYSRSEYARYMSEGNNDARPAVCDEISILQSRKNDLEKKKFAKPDYFLIQTADDLRKAVFISKKEENKSKELNDETVNNKDFEKELIERMEDFEKKITSRIDTFEKKILKLVEELKK